MVERQVTSMSSPSAGTKYTLSVILGLGALLNTVSFAVRYRASRKQHSFVISDFFSDVSYFCSAVAILALIANTDLNGDVTVEQRSCLVGGFFALFGAVESLLILAERCVLLAVQLNKPSPTENESDHGIEQQSHQTAVASKADDPVDPIGVTDDGARRRCKVVSYYCGLQVIQTSVWAVLCFAPLIAPSLKQFSTASNSSSSNDTLPYFRCVSLTLIDEAGTSIAAWQYSCFIVTMLGWCPVIVAAVGIAVAARVTLLSNRLNVIALIQLVPEVVLWLLVVMVTSVALFSDGRQISQPASSHWTLGYLIGTVLLWHSAVDVVVLLIEVCRLPQVVNEHCDETERPCPDTITVLTAAATFGCPHHQCHGQRFYVIKWLNRYALTDNTGLLKVVQAGSDNRRLWLNQVQANVALRCIGGHPNIAQQFWSSSNNLFSSVIAEATQEVTGRDCMLVCGELFSIGSLDSFVESDHTDYCITTLRAILEQVSRAIDFIHSRHLVHSNITSRCVFIAEYSHQIHHIRAVIGDFEHSFNISSSAMGVGSQQTAVVTSYSQFTAVDIQAFSLLITELIINSTRARRLGCRLKNPSFIDPPGGNNSNNNNWVSSSGVALQRLLQLVLNIEKDQRDKVKDKPLSSPFDRWSYDSRSTNLSRQTTTSGSHDDSDSSACSCADRVVDIRAHHHRHHHYHTSRGTESPWKRGWFSDSESSAFKKVRRSNMTSPNSVDCIPEMKRRLSLVDRKHGVSTRSSSEIALRKSFAHCVRCDVNIATRANNRKLFDSDSLTSGDDSGHSMTSSSMAPSTISNLTSNHHHHHHLHHHTMLNPMTSSRSKRISLSSGSAGRTLLETAALAKSTSSGGALRAISETGSVGGRDQGDTASNASCSLCCYNVDALAQADFSHPALRVMYPAVITLTSASGEPSSSAIGSDSSSSTSSSSRSTDSLDSSFSNESR